MVEKRALIPEDRSLTLQEIELVRWLLEHGTPGVAPAFLAQVDQARVASRCPCGCASIDFAIAGRLPPVGAPLQILSDYWWESDEGDKFGVFVFAKADLLAGLEVWSVDGRAVANSLPKIASLKPIACRNT